MDRQRTDRRLRLIAETSRIADALGVDLWLRGGWAMDFFLVPETALRERRGPDREARVNLPR
ncbi:hypothetical protein [Streptomyces sp. NPDC101178]|uniref:hypothetical protein n=1 Tax=Streptomyces sp. NPDC101178 TaxID=3366124 RepID=UPI0037FC4231